MKFDAVSFTPKRPFKVDVGTTEFETETYCLNLDGAIILHLKTAYLNRLLGDTPAEQRQIRKWYFYTAHLNCLYLLLDASVTRELELGYFDLEEVTTKNADVLSQNGVSISPQSNRNAAPLHPDQRLVVPKAVLDLIERNFLTATADFERVYTLSEVAKSLAAYKSADFTTAFVLAWFLLERFVELIWIDYLVDRNRELGGGNKRINSKRKESLNDSRSYPVSVKLQILELADRLTFKQFSELDSLRVKRNGIVHPRNPKINEAEVRGNPESCQQAFLLLQGFLESAFDLHLMFNTSYSHLGVFDRQ